MLDFDGMNPWQCQRMVQDMNTSGIPLQEPVVICNPFVRTWPAQTLMKLLSDLHTLIQEGEDECTFGNLLDQARFHSPDQSIRNQSGEHPATNKY